MASRHYEGESAEQLATFEAAKGERFQEEADAWVEANPKAWEYMVEAARLCAVYGRRFGIGALCEHVRWQMMADGTTEFKLNNNHRAPFARRLIKEVPECEPYITTRTSAVDLCG